MDYYYLQSSYPNSYEESSSSMAGNGKDMKKNEKRSKGALPKLSTDPQSVAARERRQRISKRFKILQSLVPGGSKMDTVSMLDEAIHYVKYLKTQIWLHNNMINFNNVDDDLSINSSTDQEALLMYSQQQHQPECFGAVDEASPPTVPLPNSSCYQLGEGTMYFYGCMQ